MSCRTRTVFGLRWLLKSKKDKHAKEEAHDHSTDDSNDEHEPHSQIAHSESLPASSQSAVPSAHHVCCISFLS